MASNSSAIPKKEISASATVPSSKVGQYIRDMKANQESSRSLRALGKADKLNASLEDLYLGNPSTTEAELSPESTKRELRKSLRVLKEKDLVITSLRGACQDLSLRCADAENTIDEMRFRGGQGLTRKFCSELQLTTPTRKDQATETVGDVLSESCSSWMEKVKHWKTESTFNASADADSGFRESDLAEQEPAAVTVTPGRRNRKPVNISPLAVTVNQPIKMSVPERGSVRRSRSTINLHWQPPSSTRDTIFDQLESLDKILEEATTQARRVQKKSQRLAQLIGSVDKKV